MTMVIALQSGHLCIWLFQKVFDATMLIIFKLHAIGFYNSVGKTGWFPLSRYGALLF